MKKYWKDRRSGKIKAPKKKKATAKKPMTKMEIARHMADLHEMKPGEARDFIADFVELAVKQVKKNGSFTIPGLVKLVKRRTKARDGRNPATGEKIRIKAKTVAKARVLKKFKDEVLG
ncbi:MAG TPA: HU family DNA-binding protein [Thermoplasmatales archaeon]|nr:MAG: HU family DNA-binding protein [Candidatus Fermentibacteria bacterium]HEC72041.1 HU family DNA-binding protein [Thermoplasmatales archaeon]